jgi:hypothetical protein
MGLNAEGVDESQFLPKEFNKKLGKYEKVPPVNAYRAKHGNIKWAGDSIKDASWLPELIFNGDTEEKVYLDTANSFFRILVHAKRTLGICDLRGALFESYPSGISQDTDLFLEILRHVVKPEVTVLIWLVWNDYNHGNIALAKKLIGTIKHGLENVQRVLDDTKKRERNSV